MATLNFKGINVHYMDLGSGEPVVFVHTGPGNSTQWLKICNILKDNYRLLAIDLYGRGGTDPWPNRPAMQLNPKHIYNFLNRIIILAIKGKHNEKLSGRGFFAPVYQYLQKLSAQDIWFLLVISAICVQL